MLINNVNYRTTEILFTMQRRLAFVNKDREAFLEGFLQHELAKITGDEFIQSNKLNPFLQPNKNRLLAWSNYQFLALLVNLFPEQCLVINNYWMLQDIWNLESIFN